MTTIPGMLNVAHQSQDDLNVIRNIYQNEIIDGVRNSLRNGNRRVLIQAHPASGKSHVAEKIAISAINKNKTVFYVAPRINLVLDIHKKFNRSGLHCGFLMSGCSQDHFARTQLCCTPSLLSRIGSSEGAPHADILIIDEAHVEQDSIAELVSHYPNATIITMTGTPLPGMDRFVDDVVKGPTMEFLTKNGLLTPVSYVWLDEKDRPEEISGKLAGKLIGEPVSAWIEHGRNLPTVLFASSVAASMELCERFKDSGVAAAHMDAKTSIEDRKQLFADIESSALKVLCTVETFSYGVDVPVVSCAILAYTVEQRVKKSPETLSAYVQKISRIIRTYPGKDRAIVIDHSGLFQAFGRIDVEHEWPILTDGGKEQLEKEMERVSRIVECKHCGAMFESNLGECPACHEPIRAHRAGPVEHIDARMGIVGPDGKVSTTIPTDNERRRFYEDAYRFCEKKGWKTGKAWHLFKKRFPNYDAPTIRVVSGGDILPANMALLGSYLDVERKAWYAKQRGIKRGEEKRAASSSQGA